MIGLLDTRENDALHPGLVEHHVNTQQISSFTRRFIEKHSTPLFGPENFDRMHQRYEAMISLSLGRERKGSDFLDERSLCGQETCVETQCHRRLRMKHQRPTAYCISIHRRR
jgi:hypothetical protein